MRVRGIHRFLRSEQGQDLTEYTLVVSFIAVASAALFLGAGGNVNTIWQSGTAIMDSASGDEGSTASTTSSGNGGGGHHGGWHGGGGGGHHGGWHGGGQGGG